METEAKLRRLHHIEKMTIKALARQTGMSRNTIRRVLRADKAGHFYQRKIQPMPALGAYIDTLNTADIFYNFLTQNRTLLGSNSTIITHLIIDLRDFLAFQA